MRALVSARLGADFTRLWTASAVSNLGDGVTMAAGPLLVASVTDDPAAIAGAVFAQQLPWLLFALLGAWLFVVSAAVPFGLDALTFAAARWSWRPWPPAPGGRCARRPGSPTRRPG
ncbi:hypothetical protein GCM10010166_32310 [Couchioplanes caeruleus subsp. azureus]|nr:hypothetical protein GCM10010166_32310 [Couchioplanes caeruleus subsp. azureus]